MTGRIYMIVVTVLLSLPVASFARFYTEDSDAVDDESRLSTENYNDEISYRWPLATERLWRGKRFGLHFNAGSYNAKRFMYNEYIKASSPDENPVTLSLTQNRHQTLLNDDPDREFRVQANQLRPVRLSLLADGESEKEHGDLGAAVSLITRPDRRLELFAWEVDYFYNTKKPYDTDKMNTKSRSYGVRYDWAFAEYFRTYILWEVDTPLEWTRKSRSYIYSREETRQQLRVDFGYLDQGFLFRLDANLEEKKEGKIWIDNADAELREKTMTRETATFEAMTNWNFSGNDITAGVVWIERDVDYAWSNTVDDSTLLEVDEKSSPDSVREEMALYSTFYNSMSKGMAMQYGVHANFVSIDETTDGVTANFSENEYKLQTAWHYLMSENANLFLNLTWDMDDLMADFPRNPWGGGNIQVTWAF